jgi:hypothetical protein
VSGAVLPLRLRRPAGHLIKIRAPIEPVLRTDENIVDDIEPGGQCVLPKIHTRDMPIRIPCLFN